MQELTDGKEVDMAADVPISEVDYPSPESVQCPYHYFKELREADPVHRLKNGDYLITRFDDCVDVAMRPDVFSNFIGTSTEGFAESLAVDLNSGLDDEINPWPVPFTDPPAHRRKRRMLMPLVSPERLKLYDPIIRRVVDELIDGFADRGSIEFNAEFALHVPPMVTLRIFGVPEEDEALVRKWMMTFEGHGFRHLPAEEKRRQIDAMSNAKDYFVKALLDRVDNPKDDFLSIIVREKLKLDGKLHMHATVSEVLLLYAAAYLNTVFMLTSTMDMLLRHPDEMAGVIADPKLIPLAIDETLRLTSPVQWLQRAVLEDTEISGVPIPKGSVVLIGWAAANQDPAKFPDPERFWLERPNSYAHIAFGYGQHKCLGMPIARLEGLVAFEQLFSRLKNFRFSEGKSETPYIYSPNHRGKSALYVEFDRA